MKCFGELQAELGLTLLQARKVASHRPTDPRAPVSNADALGSFTSGQACHKPNFRPNWRVGLLNQHCSRGAGCAGVMEVSAMRCAHSRGKRFLATDCGYFHNKRHGTVCVICNVAKSGLYMQGSFLNFCFSYVTCIDSPLEPVSWELGVISLIFKNKPASFS